MRRALSPLVLGVLAGCTVWPVNQDPAGMEYRREANQVIDAVQSYRHDAGQFPADLGALTPRYIAELPHVPALRYHAADGSLDYAYIPSWPQLRPVRCFSEGNTTVWRCAEHLTDQPM
ncbi:MAG TPA: hypothetical protein VGM17_06500 [Rhizomicrobium sp.]|jgi:hypothetical protein